MAKLSLWLLTPAKDQPFEFLDHTLRCGDALVGLHSLDQLKFYRMQPEQDAEARFFGSWLEGVDEAIKLRLELKGLPAMTVEAVEQQERLALAAADKLARLRCAADVLVAAALGAESAGERVARTQEAAQWARG